LTTLPLDPDTLLTTTRTVRKRLDFTRPVPTELVRQCLEIALQAPSGSNTQTWHWIVVTDPDQRAALGALYRRAFEGYASSSHHIRNQVHDDARSAAAQQRSADSAEYLASRMGEAPVLVVPCIEIGGRLPSEAPPSVLWGSLLPAAWSYMLAARARGLGTAWTTLHLAHEAEAAAVLGLPDTIRQGLLIPTAYYTGETFKPAPRRPLDEVLHHDRW
jgi:nitroreductase